MSDTRNTEHGEAITADEHREAAAAHAQSGETHEADSHEHWAEMIDLATAHDEADPTADFDRGDSGHLGNA